MEANRSRPTTAWRHWRARTSERCFRPWPSSVLNRLSMVPRCCSSGAARTKVPRPFEPDDPRLLQPSPGVTHRVAAEVGVRHQLAIGREARCELTGIQPPPEVFEHLGPQGVGLVRSIDTVTRMCGVRAGRCAVRGVSCSWLTDGRARLVRYGHSDGMCLMNQRDHRRPRPRSSRAACRRPDPRPRHAASRTDDGAARPGRRGGYRWRRAVERAGLADR
jgi:hypothetical protein